MKTVVVTRRGADRIRSGHLWVYRSDVTSTQEALGGSLVRVRDLHGNFLAQALYSDASEISLRVLTLNNETIDADWWQERIREAASRRRTISVQANAYRLVYTEGDLLPSLIVDRYDDVLVLQTLSQGTEAIKSMLVELLVSEFQPRAIVERNDVRVRELEGLETVAGALYGDAPAVLEVRQHGIKFLVAPLGGQKTGAFLDQRENRVAASTLAHGRALDCFSFTGGFALHLARVCDQVIGIDLSREAISTARSNVDLNGITNIEFREDNVFDALREYETRGERFDTIILDPPAFAKNRASLAAARRGYKEINLRAIKLLNPGGVLVTCTCSYHVSEALFLELIAEAAIDAHRRVQIIEKRMQASDHPVLLTVPETYYLKCVIARVI